MKRKSQPIEFKPSCLTVKLYPNGNRRKGAKSLIDFVLMANNINPAQREALKKAKELLNDK